MLKMDLERKRKESFIFRIKDFITSLFTKDDHDQYDDSDLEDLIKFKVVVNEVD